MRTPTIDPAAAEAASTHPPKNEALTDDAQPSARAPKEGGAPAAFRAAIRHLRNHPYLTIAAATAAGTLIDVEMAIAAGVVASVVALLAAPNGTEKRRELERRARQLGRGAVTAIRERPPRAVDSSTDRPEPTSRS